MSEGKALHSRGIGGSECFDGSRPAGVHVHLGMIPPREHDMEPRGRIVGTIEDSNSKTARELPGNATGRGMLGSLGDQGSRDDRHEASGCGCFENRGLSGLNSTKGNQKYQRKH